MSDEKLTVLQEIRAEEQAMVLNELDMRRRERVAALDAAIAALGGGWLPIESAPTARREFFLAHVNGAVVMAHQVCGEIWQEGEPDGSFSSHPIHPTHWMPLPAPPSKEG